MANSMTPQDEHLWVFFPGELTIYTAAECKKLLDIAFEQDSGVNLDLSYIESIDTAGLQLLVLTKMEAVLRGKAFTLAQVSPSVASALEVSGLHNYFCNDLHSEFEAKGIA